jgi:hypothetical protein
MATLLTWPTALGRFCNTLMAARIPEIAHFQFCKFAHILPLSDSWQILKLACGYIVGKTTLKVATHMMINRHLIFGHIQYTGYKFYLYLNYLRKFSSYVSSYAVSRIQIKITIYV